MLRVRVLSLSGATVLAAITVLGMNGIAKAGSDETIRFRVSQIPKFSHEDKMGPMHRSLLVFEGSSAEDWSEAIEVLQVARKGPYKHPGEISSALRASRREKCSVVRDSVLAADDSSVFWSMVSDSCALFAPQFSLSRVLCGKKTTFILIYTSHTTEVSPERRNEMASLLLSASIVKD